MLAFQGLTEPEASGAPRGVSFAFRERRRWMRLSRVTTFTSRKPLSKSKVSLGSSETGLYTEQKRSRL